MARYRKTASGLSMITLTVALLIPALCLGPFGLVVLLPLVLVIPSVFRP